MWPVCKKEFSQFFSSLTGIIALSVFLLLNGLFLFVFPDNIPDAGYASLDRFFDLAPWILTFLVPAITMRSLAEEFRGGTFEILRTQPLGDGQLVMGKFLGCLGVITLALLPTLVYVIAIQGLSAPLAGLDGGGTAGSYLGLFFLAAAFTAIGICCSSLTSNAVVAFILGAFACFILYGGFTALSQIPALGSGADYYLQLWGIDFHYRSMSRGVIDSRDLLYFLTLAAFFLTLTRQILLHRKP